MQAIKDLQKRWDDTGRFRKLHASLALEPEGVVLGAKTIVSKRDDEGALKIDGARTLTLLSVACGRPIDSSILHKFHYASKHARAGNEAMAAMHIALAGLPVLRDPVGDAKRLFIADGLMNEGVAPRDIWTALEFDPAPLDALEKFNQDQPRVPAGNPTGGQWTRDGAPSPALLESPPILAPRPPPPTAAPTSTGASFAEQALEAAGTAARTAARAGSRYAPELLGIAERAAPPVAFLSELLDSTPTGGTLFEGDVVGRPDLQFSWYQDELWPRITRKSDGSVFNEWRHGRDRTFLDHDGRIVARVVGRAVIVDAAAFSLPSSQRKDQDPELCPEPPGPDKEGMTGERGDRSRAYANYMKGLINPERPTPPEYGYQLPNPEWGGELVFYDDCMHVNGWMVDYKGLEYADLLARNNLKIDASIAQKWLRQANNQINASGGRPIVWFFAEQDALAYARKVFDQPGNEDLQRIMLVYAPPPNDATWRWRTRRKKKGISP